MTTVNAVASTCSSGGKVLDGAVGGALARELIQRVSRSFYGPRQSIVVDQLVKKEAMRDDELAGKVAMQTKDVAKSLARLVEDKIVSVHRRSELRDTFQSQKAGQRVYYFIDYTHALDVVKWRMYKMQQVVDTKLRNELDQQGYVCPTCKKKFTPLDASNLFDPSRNVLACDVCDTEVINNENEQEIKGNKDRMQRLVRQTERIRQLLKRLEQVTLPRFDVVAWLEEHGPASSKAIQQAQARAAAAGTAANPAVKIELAQEADEQAERAKLLQQAEEKRQQNALPDWIAKSTISGEATSTQRELEAKAAFAAQEMSKPDLAAAAAAAEGAGPLASYPDSPGKKPVSTTKGADDDLDSYYARLAEQERQLATRAVKAESGAEDEEVQSEDDEDEDAFTPETPLSLSSVASPLLPSGPATASASASPAMASTPSASALPPHLSTSATFSRTQSGLSSVDMDNAPGSVDSNVSLDVLEKAVSDDLAARADSTSIGTAGAVNGSGKRARSEDAAMAGDGDASAGTQKRTKLETPSVAADGHEELEGDEDDDEDEDDDDLFEKDEMEDENPLIKVGDRQVPFDQVDDELTQAMTPDEYAAYWEVYQRKMM